MISEIVIKAQQVLEVVNVQDSQAIDIPTLIGTSAALMFAIGGTVVACKTVKKSQEGKSEDEKWPLLK